MRTISLNELKEAYSPYALEWARWITDKSCLLNDFERYVMEVHLRNGFEIVLEELAMFYNRNEVTTGLVNKLKDQSHLLLYGNFVARSLNGRYVEDG